MAKFDWQSELDEYDDEFGEIDGPVNIWEDAPIDHPYGWIPEQSDSYIPVDKQVLKAERHNKKLQRQAKENKA